MQVLSPVLLVLGKKAKCCFGVIIVLYLAGHKQRKPSDLDSSSCPKAVIWRPRESMTAPRRTLPVFRVIVEQGVTLWENKSIHFNNVQDDLCLQYLPH